jgi:branched-chain amino acid transport system permease protein
VDLSSSLLARAFPDWNLSHIGVVGLALILLVLFFPKGILGTIRERWLKWLP